jgi:glycosyltransferase involved in cell wall biosynthesis
LPASPIALSIVIPAHNASAVLSQCLGALTASCSADHEIIVVDDGSTDDSREVAARYAVRALSTGGRRGPAFARNLGAKAARGAVLLFLDADVRVHPDTLEKIQAAFEADPALDALIGSYDSTPQSPDFLSQYRNLMHAWTHQTGKTEASTFWSGCGAIRRALFLEHAGFSESYSRPAIEDIELGYRLVRARRKLVLDRSLLVTHLKRWTFRGLVKTDILDRGIPWTELILRERRMPNDLNLQLSQRVSVALALILMVLSVFTAVLWRGYFLIPVLAVLAMLLARYWTEYAEPDRPPFVLAAMLGVVAFTSVQAFRLRMFGLMPPLMLALTLLFLRHRYAGNSRKKRFLRFCAIVCAAGSVLLATFYLPGDRLIFAWMVVCATLGILNSQFYLFLVQNRGISFALAAIPFHLLYHFYNGVSFLIGLLRHLCSRTPGAIRDGVVTLARHSDGIR